MYRIPFSRIIYVEPVKDENWCRLYLAGSDDPQYNPWEIPLCMGEVWNYMEHQTDVMYRLGRKYLINSEYIRFIDTNPKTSKLVLSDGTKFYEVHPSREFLIAIKEVFKKQAKHVVYSNEQQ